MHAAKTNEDRNQRKKRRKINRKFVLLLLYDFVVRFCCTNTKRSEWNMNAHFMRQIERRAFVTLNKRNNMESDCFTESMLKINDFISG